MTDRQWPEASILTRSGNFFWPLEPEPADIRIDDIAHALAAVCRFTGHTTRPYTVAEHSILVGSTLPEGTLRLWGLLHDASEAYLSDVAGPIKKHLANYEEIEDRLMQCIAAKFGLPWPMPCEVKVADKYMLVVEQGSLMNYAGRDRPPLPDRQPLYSHEWDPGIFAPGDKDLIGKFRDQVFVNMRRHIGDLGP